MSKNENEIKKPNNFNVFKHFLHNPLPKKGKRCFNLKQSNGMNGRSCIQKMVFKSTILRTFLTKTKGQSTVVLSIEIRRTDGLPHNNKINSTHSPYYQKDSMFLRANLGSFLCPNLHRQWTKSCKTYP